MKIEIHDGVSWSELEASEPNDGDYDWDIPDGQAIGDDYRVRVTSTSFTDFKDAGNDIFSIVAVSLPPQQLFKLFASGDLFGWSVAVGGNRAVIGAPYDDSSGESSGSAYVFDISTGEQIAKLLPEDGAASDLFGRAVAVSGDRIIIGAFGDDDNGINSGNVYVFSLRTGEQLLKISPDDGSASDAFGISVAISGDRAVIGAHWDGDNGPASGSAYVFDVKSTPFLPISDPFNGALKRPRQKANS